MEISNSDPCYKREDKSLVNLQVERTARHFGNNIPLFFIKNEPYLTLGPHWRPFLCAFVMMMALGLWVSLATKARLSPRWHFSINIVVLWEAFSFLWAAFRNPGMLSHLKSDSQIEAELLKDPNYCGTCNIVRGLTVYHCPVCNICIEGYDHHCPWISKCIGKNNFFAFRMFLISTAFFFAFCIFVGARALLVQDNLEQQSY